MVRKMIISIKDSVKLLGISIMACCAVTVCNLFLNFYIDLIAVSDLIDDIYSKIFYDAQLMTARVVCAVSGGCLLLTTVIMLFFYIRHYIDSHSKEIGILKALGYPDVKVAKGFSVFGFSVFIGCLLGYLLSFILMPGFYELQNKEGYLPDFSIHFHVHLFLFLVIIPTLFFASLAVVYSLNKLKQPCISLLRGDIKRTGKHDNGKDGKGFLADMKSAVLKSRRTLVFFIAFSSFCFSAMIQMSSSMDELSSEMMGAMILIIGIVLAFTTLYIATTAVIRSNKKNITMMRVFGYQGSECKKSVLDGYRPAAYIGFIAGTVYQYLLLKVMVEIVFSDIKNVPDYKFDIPMFFITLGVFTIVYEGIMLIYGHYMKKISLKHIMSE